MFNFDFDWSSVNNAMANLVQLTYDWGTPKSTVADFVETGAITTKDYKKITGDDYENGDENPTSKVTS